MATSSRVKSDFLAPLPPLTRLSAPDFDPDAATVYQSAIDALDDARVAYLLGGALALNAHTGIWRDTKDLDVFVRPADAKRTLDALKAAEFKTEIVYESWLGKGWKGPWFIDVIWRNANALFPVTDAWFERPMTMDVVDRQTRVVPLEELLASKMMVMGRYRFDGADMLHILHAAGARVDWDRLLGIVGEHAGLMLAHLHAYRWAYPGWRERVPREVIDRFTEQAERAESSFGPFRARLVDIQSFEVDVQEWGMPDPHRQALAGIFGDPEGRQ